MNHPGTSRHHIGSLIPPAGHGPARVWPWAAAGLLAGPCLGCGYGLLAGLMAGLMAGIAGAAWGFVIGGAIGLIGGSLTGLLIGLAQVLLRRTAIPTPAIAVAVTEMFLLPPQLLAAGHSGQPGAAIFIYIPSVLGIGTAAALGFLLPPAKRPLRGPRDPDPGTPQPPRNTQPFGATGLRLRAYGHRPHRPHRRHPPRPPRPPHRRAVS